MFYSDWLEATAVVVFVGMLASIALAFGFRAVTRSALPEVVKRYCKALLCLLLTLVLAAMIWMAAAFSAAYSRMNLHFFERSAPAGAGR